MKNSAASGIQTLSKGKKVFLLIFLIHFYEYINMLVVVSTKIVVNINKYYPSWHMT